MASSPTKEDMLQAIANVQKEHPDFGAKRITAQLQEEMPLWNLKQKKIYTLMKKNGLLHPHMSMDNQKDNESKGLAEEQPEMNEESEMSKEPAMIEEPAMDVNAVKTTAVDNQMMEEEMVKMEDNQKEEEVSFNVVKEEPAVEQTVVKESNNAAITSSVTTIAKNLVETVKEASAKKDLSIQDVPEIITETLKKCSAATDEMPVASQSSTVLETATNFMATVMKEASIKPEIPVVQEVETPVEENVVDETEKNLMEAVQGLSAKEDLSTQDVPKIIAEATMAKGSEAAETQEMPASSEQSSVAQEPETLKEVKDSVEAEVPAVKEMEIPVASNSSMVQETAKNLVETVKEISTKKDLSMQDVPEILKKTLAKGSEATSTDEMAVASKSSMVQETANNLMETVMKEVSVKNEVAVASPALDVSDTSKMEDTVSVVSEKTSVFIEKKDIVSLPKIPTLNVKKLLPNMEVLDEEEEHVESPVAVAVPTTTTYTQNVPVSRPTPTTQMDRTSEQASRCECLIL